MNPRWKLGAWRDWASLARLPNVPTVWSNVFTAWVLAGGLKLEGMGLLLLALAGGSALYMGGTALSDVQDIEFDRVHRPERPLPGGRVSVVLARRVAIGLLAAGALSLFGVFNPGVIFVLIVITFYISLHKESAQGGALFMGLCRMGLAMAVANFAGWLLGEYSWDRGQTLPPALSFWLAALFGYILWLTWLAADERVARRRQLISAMLLALPLLDGVFLALAGYNRWLGVPLACFLVAGVLRRVAAAT